MTAAEMFRVDPERIRRLDPYGAVDLASRLIRADAAASGIPASIIDIPSAVTAPDGGIDGKASGSPRQSIQGLVKRGTTAYQFRTGAFAPGSSIADILFDKKGGIKPRIRSCVEGGGTLVVMLFGWDGTARTDNDALAEKFQRALAAKSSAMAGAGEEGRGGSMHFLAGYLAGMRRERPGAAEDAMDRMLERGGALCGALPMAAGMSGGISERSARRLARAAAGGGIRIGALAGAVRGGALDGVSEEAFWMVAGALAAGATGADARAGGGGGGEEAAAGSAALDIVHGRYAARGAARRAGRMPAEAVAGILLHERVLGGRPGAGARRVDAGRWIEAARALARQEKDEGMAARLAGAVIGRLGAPGMFEEDAENAAPVLDEIARGHPRAVWRIAASFMGPPLDKRACIVRAWLAGRGGGRMRTAAEGGGRREGGIGAVPASVVLEWVAEDPPARARRAAEVASPPRLDAARDLVARFGHIDGVADGAAGALEAWQAWAARESDTEDARARLESMRRGEKNPAAAAWLDRCIGMLDARIAGARGRQAPLISR